MSSRVSPWFLALLAVTVLGGFLAASATTRPVLTTGIVLLVLAGWAVSLCLHEFGHAYTAYRGGDRSVRAKGYLTLDIRRYADLGLSLVLPVFFLLLGGIPLPGGAVWIDHGAIRSRAVRSLVSLAGPAAKTGNAWLGRPNTMRCRPVPAQYERGSSSTCSATKFSTMLVEIGATV